MNKAIVGLAVVALALIVGAGWYFLRYQDPAPEPVVERQQIPEPPQEPTPLYPAPEVPTVTETVDEPEEPVEIFPPAPGLEQSDPYMVSILEQVFPTARLEDHFVLNNLIRRIVVTIDNLPRRELPGRLMPLRPVPGLFEVEGPPNNLVISDRNFRRYTPLINLFTSVDTQRIVRLYAHLYPLFQQAYRDLGYPRGYFNDRLVHVIDHLLAAPQVSGPIRVEEHVVRYRFTDPGLEALSSGEKIMIRIGPDNARKVRDKLRDIREVITARQNI
jgi:hypothetical protein